MKPIVFTTVYKIMEDYLIDFLNCLNAQTYLDYKLLILNDGLENLSSYINNYNFDVEIIDIKGNLSISEVRQKGIEYCIKNKYEYIIFADSDDYFSNDRIEKSLDYLKSGNDIIINNLSIVNNNKIPMCNDYFRELIGKKISFIDEIDGNYFGLSNTAVRTELLKKVIPIPKYIEVVDWWIFSILCYHTDKIYFVKNVYTYYRQYANNYIGAKKVLNKDAIMKGIKVKRHQYYSLYRYFLESDLNMSKYFKCKSDNFNKLENLLNWDMSNFDRYIKILNSRNHNNSWWSNIIETTVLEE